jgi:hypothetical protein
MALSYGLMRIRIIGQVTIGLQRIQPVDRPIIRAMIEDGQPPRIPQGARKNHRDLVNRRRDPLSSDTGIAKRYSCVPADWCETPHGWEERTATYQHHALDLLQRVAIEAVAEAGLLLADIDFLVLNTITGLAIPSLDAKLMNRRPDLERLPIFGLGCGGGVAGLTRTARLSTCAHCAPVPMIRAWRSSWQRRCSAMAPQRWCCAAALQSRATGRLRGPHALWPLESTGGAIPSTSWAGTSRRTALASC